MDGPFTFETLSNQESAEKKDRKLTKIESSFFRYIANYLDQLESAYRKEHALNASSKKAAFLIDELRNAQNKAEELWKAREKKVVQFAQVNARKDPLPPPPENLTREESELYHQLVNVFRAQWQRLLPLRSAALGQVTAPPPRGALPAGAAPAATTAAPAAVQATAATVTVSKDEVQTIRALVDIPPFVGFDGKTYRIKKGEVLSLPKKFALILKERNQAALVG
jgi:DNA replication initiation complex subunit (GINS family)